MDAKWCNRAGAAAFALGLSLAGPQALGLAWAETEDATSVSSAPSDQTSSATAGPSGRSPARKDRDATGAHRSAATAQPRTAAASADHPRESATIVEPESRRDSANAGAAARSRRGPQSPSDAVAVDVAVRVTGEYVQARRPAAAVATAAASGIGTADAVVPALQAAVSAPRAAVPAAAPILKSLDNAVAEFFDAAGSWLSSLPASPLSDLFAGALLLVRRSLLGPEGYSAGPAAVGASVTQSVELTATPAQHVLLIGIDGTNLSAILADNYNQAFFDLISTSTTAAATMVGHTTISNPSWTGILTGVWSETAGVSNNVFTPWTYDTWPTVFNQLESHDPTIQTTVVANWEVIAQIAGAGSKPADEIFFYEQIGTGWEATDTAVGAKSIEEINATVAGIPSFQMTYFVGVDDTGHDTYGAGSPEYKEALRNVNDNLAAIMAAVTQWEIDNGEDWTVIAVTDHGQVLNAPLSPILAGLLAHGFQSPIETTVFVIADGPEFGNGFINNTYSQLDITPTVLRLFGAPLESYFAGMPLMDKTAGAYQPVVPGQAALKGALNDAIAMYGYPDVATNIALAIRTIAATAPYAIYTLVTGLADPGDCSSFTCVLFEADTLPEILALPVLFIGAVVYQIVNIPVQIIVRLTGVTGNSIIPPQWWPYYPVPGVQPAPTATLPASTVAA